MEVTGVLDAVDGRLVLGRYRLLRRIGAGGFGTVHEAEDERLRRRVALKVIPADTSTPARAAREALAAARLDHPGIVAVFDAGEEPGFRYLVSELVEGRTLAQLEADDALSDRDALRVGLALADALEHAHDRGVVHRDVKPQNVIVPGRRAWSAADWRAAAKLTDFGVAHLVDDDALTHTGDVVGTLAYMAPEQAEGKRVDHRTDLYALGLVLYEALAGHHPVRGANPAATARKLGTKLTPLAKARRDLPVALCAAIDRAVRPGPGERGSVGALADALEAALDGVGDEGGAVPRHPLETPSRLPAPPPAVARVAAALAAGGLALLALSTRAAGRTPLAELVDPRLVAVLIVVAVGFLPRAGWAFGATGLVVVLGVGAPGVALIVLAAGLPVALATLGRGGRLWSLPGAAALLGLAGLPGAYPALLLRVASLHERVALGLLGAWWLSLTEAVGGRSLLLGADGQGPVGWERDASAAAQAVVTAATSPTLAVAGAWALAAGVGPWVIRGRTTGSDVVAAGAWAAGLAGLTAALAGWLDVGEPVGLAASLVVGALVAAGAARVGQRTNGHTPGMDLTPAEDAPKRRRGA